MEYGYIYKIENHLDKIVYIGCTTSDPQKRWNSHKRSASNGYNNCPYLYNAMRKYGIGNFSFTVIAKANNKKELDNMERAFISIFNTHFTDGGYNIRFGGKTNGKWSTETKIKMSKSAPKTAVVQYSKDGERIAEYKSIKNAAESLNTYKSGIVNCCKGRAYTSGGFVFRYKGDGFNKFSSKPEHGNASKAVSQHDKETKELINTFKSATEAANHIGVNYIEGITRCCNNKIETSSGFIWNYI